MSRKPYFLAKGAVVRGDVTFGEDVGVWFNAVIRGDNGSITVGTGTNIQDNATLHVDVGGALTIGSYVTVGHNAILHGCTIGDNVLIGMGSIIMNGAVIGENSIIGAGAVVTEHAVIPPNSLVVGLPAKVRREVSKEESEAVHAAAVRYIEEAKAYVNGEFPEAEEEE